MTKDTIAAISTPTGVGAIGIVRLSGSACRDILKKVWINPNHPVDKFETHRLYYGMLSTPQDGVKQVKQDGVKSIDNVLAVWMQEPRSYTGEDIVEIHCHGGSVATKSILEAVLNSGARPALPGEFTRRAFLNGRLDLAQAEAVAEVINATSERALRLANEQLNGRLSGEINNAQGKLKELIVSIEAAIDFPEEDIEIIKNEQIENGLKNILERLSSLSMTYHEGKMIHDGVRVIIVGKPNVGKSSILNALVGSDRAIVHHSPGTTRDIIEEDVEIDGMKFRLIDTAGIRNSTCEIEQMGIKRARMRLSEADCALVVLDASNFADEEDKAIICETKNLKRIFILNKIDLCPTAETDSIFKSRAETNIKTSA
ncbi:MAG: tRNA uridine-5-carboxymethylaminomethyl(34) synthesis GTPase MnmE, partial [Deltaproteobacteria bacterium]|nr:tRNA uridine-5-carboxymethylaminomethyl(34) synthesis GTPase MnmE [Deltaproteobacteria bacterium]